MTESEKQQQQQQCPCGECLSEECFRGSSFTEAKSCVSQYIKYLLVIPLMLLVVQQFTTSANPELIQVHKDDVAKTIVSNVSTKSIEMFSDRYYNSGPHLMGQNWALADHTRALFERFGFEAEIEEFEVLRNLPKNVSVAVLGANGTSLDLEEEPLKHDPSTNSPERIPIFHSYSASGNATGKLIYANYGRKEDFDLLNKLGYNVSGSIVLVRYGELFRGLKVKFAEQAGAAGILIYSDPSDDGKFTEANGYKAYPDGPARNPKSVQRGSVQDMGAAPGDPTTPGFASEPGCEHRKPKSIPGIPSVPISAANGEKLLALLNSRGELIRDWSGSLRADYTVGPSAVDIELVNDQKYEFVKIYNVIGTLKGKNSDEIIIGNHRDAWILGGADPNSGTATMLEVARVLGNLAKSGWKPERTIKFASWDGEEYGMVGSTEWGEKHINRLLKNAVAYFNVDLAYSGAHFSVSASPLLQSAINHAAKYVQFGNESLYEYWLSSDSRGKIQAPGSGSDYVVFLDHLGIPSLDVEFVEGGDSPVYHYHSNYDSYYWQTHFGDTHFKFQAALAKFLGVITHNIADSALFPFRTEAYSQLLSNTVTDYLGTSNSTSAHHLGHALARFSEATIQYDAYIAQLSKDYKTEPSWWKRTVLKVKIGVANRKLKYFERGFLHKKGLPGRSWYKHIVFAPGRYTGYAGQILPGLGEAVEDGDRRGITKWSDIICEKVCKLTERIQ